MTGAATFGIVGIIWVAVIVSMAVLAIWIAVLLIKFLQLKNAELKRRAGRANDEGLSG